MFKAVGATVEDRHNEVVAQPVFGLLMRGRSVLKAVGATVEDGHNVVVAWRVFGLLVRERPY